MSGKVRLKQASGWFAAGREWRRALGVLSDGAFKVFVYVSLEAERATRRLSFQQSALARALGKSRRSVQSYLKELEDKRICRVLAARNQHTSGILEICSEYWPYVTEDSSEATLASDQESYVEAVGKMFLAEPCVRSVYSAADRRLAQAWSDAGVSLVLVEQAILVGCGRKYVSWLNGQNHEPIGSLAFFAPVVEELSAFQLKLDYQNFNRWQTEKYREKWLAATESASSSKTTGAGAKVARAKARSKTERRDDVD